MVTLAFRYARNIISICNVANLAFKVLRAHINMAPRCTTGTTTQQSQTIELHYNMPALSTKARYNNNNNNNNNQKTD